MPSPLVARVPPMIQSMTLAEALHTLGLLGTSLPRFVTSVSGAGDTLEVVADAGAVRNLPAPLKLATRMMPTVRAHVRVASYADGVATLDLEANAGGLPAHKLLGLAKSRIEGMVATKRLPYGSIRVLDGGQVALHVQRLLDAKHPGFKVNQFMIHEGAVWFDVEALQPAT